MFEFQEKKKIRHVLYSQPMLLILGVLTVISLSAAYKMYEKTRESANNRDTALRESVALNIKENELGTHLWQLTTGRGVEEEIRKKFRVVKGNEAVIIVVGEKENGANASGTAQTQPSFETLFDRIRKLFQ